MKFFFVTICLHCFLSWPYAVALKTQSTPDLSTPACGPYEKSEGTCICAEQIKINDARALQESSGMTLPMFFVQHGFVLVSNIEGGAAKGDQKTILNNIYPEDTIIVDDDHVGAIRGPGQAAYSVRNHQDCSLNASGFHHNIGSLVKPAFPSFVSLLQKHNPSFVHWINFWGPVNMTEPLMHRPLAFADPNFVNMDKINAFSAQNDTWQVSLTCTPGQTWYYYPNMRTDEVLVFSHFAYYKGDDWDTPYMRTNLHGSFDNPRMRVGAESRLSAERRVFLRSSY